MRTDPREACKNERQRLFWALVHDGLAHPLMALTGFCKLALRFHDWTSHRAWPRPRRAFAYNKPDWNGYQTNSLAVIDLAASHLRAQGVPFVITKVPGKPYRLEFLYV